MTTAMLLGAIVAGSILAGLSSARLVPATGVDYLNISTTESLQFNPTQLTVVAGDQVHLVITQLADFNHTFVLSPLAGFAFSSTATGSNVSGFFHAHQPLANVSLGSTPGKKFSADFAAPPAGSYEFLCTINTQALGDHFQLGMHGQLVSQAPGSSSSSSSSSGPLTTTLLVVIAVVVIVVIVAAVFLLRQRGRGPSHPPQPKTTNP